jgi:hypothetical protein
MKVSSITSNINNSDCINKNSTNKQEEKNPEFGLMLEKSENDLIYSENSITDDKISENEIILNQYLANGINFLSKDN